MKKLLKCRVSIALLAGWAVFSVIGYLGKDSIYKNYQQNLKTTPYFVTVLHGIHDGIYPWSGGAGNIWDLTADNQKPAMNGTGQIPSAGTDESGTERPEEKTTETEKQIPETETIKPIKEFVPVDKTYFDDAVFIGDSRTVGLHDYGGLSGATFYATVGLNIYDMWTDRFCEVDGEKVTLEEALSAKQYQKIYFQIGINEMGRGTVEGFMTAYAQSVERFKQLQPDAIIYVQGIMKVTKEKSESDPIFNNPGITKRNECIIKLADNITVFYIDVNDAVCDEEGNLRPELTFDNLHLLGSKYNIWVDFLMTKGVERKVE